MIFNFFGKKNKPQDIKEEWNLLGEKYTSEVNAMVEFGEKNGWEKWKGKEPTDKRDHLAAEVITRLKEANQNGTVTQFRADFPPAHSPLIEYLKAQGQSIEQLHYIENEKIVFLSGASYQKRQAYLLDGDKVIELESSIDAIGKSKRNNVFAIAADQKIVTTQGWQGDVICIFHLNSTKIKAITDLIPFNDGKKVLLVSSDGIYILSENSEVLIHPVPDIDDEGWSSDIDMENATFSNDNQYIVVGDQCSDHRILDQDLEEVGSIGPQSAYPHFCLFSADDEQLVTNSCHFYNGVTIGASTSTLKGLHIEAYEKDNSYPVIDDNMRVYAGIAVNDHYILGDAHGYIKAFSKDGKCIWKHYVGSTISGITISDDQKFLWVGSNSGMLHKLKLRGGHRDLQTIGNGPHFEEFRLIIWKGEEKILKW